MPTTSVSSAEGAVAELAATRIREAHSHLTKTRTDLAHIESMSIPSLLNPTGTRAFEEARHDAITECSEAVSEATQDLSIAVAELVYFAHHMGLNAERLLQLALPDDCAQIQSEATDVDAVVAVWRAKPSDAPFGSQVNMSLLKRTFDRWPRP